MKRVLAWFMLAFSCGFFTFACRNLTFTDIHFVGKKDHASSPKSEIFTLLDYFRYLDSLSKERFDEEHNDVQNLFLKDRKLLNRLKLAILLSWPDTGVQDDIRSLDLLTKYSEDPAREDRLLRELSFFVSYFIQRVKSEQEHHQGLTRQLSESEEQNKKLKAQGKKELEQNKKLKEQNKNLEKAIRQLRKENEKQAKERKNLQKMIDGLKSIEKNLMKRDQTIPNEGRKRNDE